MHGKENIKGIIHKRISLDNIQVRNKMLEEKNDDLQSQLKTVQKLLTKFEEKDKKKCNIATQTYMVRMYVLSILCS